MSAKTGHETYTVSKWDNPVDVVLDGELTTFPTRKIARDFFFEAICGTEGSEREQYTAISIDLEETDQKMVHDGESWEENPTIRSVCKFKGDHIGDRQWLDKPTTYDHYIDSQKSVIAKIRKAKSVQKPHQSKSERNAGKHRSQEER